MYQLIIDLSVTDNHSMSYPKSVYEKIIALTEIFEIEIISKVFNEQNNDDGYLCSLDISLSVLCNNIHYNAYVEIIKTFALEYNLNILSSKIVPFD